MSSRVTKQTPSEIFEDIPVFTEEKDRHLMKKCLLDLSEDNLDTALRSHGSIEQTLVFLCYKYQRILAAAERELKAHESRERTRLFEGGGWAVEKAKAKVDSMDRTIELTEVRDEAEARYDFLRNMTFAARNRLRALEHLANQERLEQRIDSQSSD